MALGFLLLLPISLLPANSATPPKAGSSCTKQGATQTYQGKKYTCTKSGKKLVWDKGTPVKAPSQAKRAEESTMVCNSSKIDQQLTNAVYPKADDKIQSFQLGPITVQTTTPITLRDLENSTYIIISFKNPTNSDRTIRIPNFQKVLQSRPNWITHMYPIIDDEVPSSNIYDFTVMAGKTRDFYFYISNESPPGQSEASLTFEFQLPASGDSLTLPVMLKAFNGEYGDKGQRVPASAELRGTVVDEYGKPMAGASVVAYLESMAWRREAFTEQDGEFVLPLVSEAGFKAMTGGRQTKPKVAWGVNAEANGFKITGMTNLNFKNGEVRTCTIQLARASKWNMTLASTYVSDNKYGFWDMSLFGAGDRLVATPGWHPSDSMMTLPPGEGAIPGDVTALDLSGNLLWKVKVGDFCWRLAVSNNGNQIAVNCADGKLRVISQDGKIVHERVLSNGRNSSAALSFSPDGKRLLTSIGTEIIALDTTSWSEEWSYPIDAYNAVWSDTPAGIVVASATGVLNSLTDDGKLKWKRGMGGVPLYLKVDDSGRIIAAGKSRVVHSWSPSGQELWIYELSQTSQRTQYNAGASKSGDFIVIPTQNGMNQAFSASGKLLWERLLPATFENSPFPPVAGPGHNSNFVAPDGSFIAQGARLNQLLIYGKDGTLLFESQKFPVRPGYFDGGNYHPSANSLVSTTTGSVIAIGSSDATIRIFKRS